MADLPRHAKSGNDWNIDDLEAFNISIERQDAAMFFGIADLPKANVDPELLTIEKATEMVSDRNAELATLLDRTIYESIGSHEDSAVNDFVVELLKTLGYVRRSRVARTRKEFSSLVCREYCDTFVDVCLIDGKPDAVLLVVQEDKRYKDDEWRDPIPQLIAAAIAVFQFNNDARHTGRRKSLDSAIIPGIIMNRTVPSFFKVPITTELAEHVGHGLYPPTPTIVHEYCPGIPKDPHNLNLGMSTLNNRANILSCFEAFKGVVGI